MTETMPSFLPDDTGRGKATRASDTPTALPPVTSAHALSGCGCNGRASAASTAAGTANMTATASLAAPSLRPATGAGTGGAGATWQSNAHVLGTWSINQDRNCWAYLDTVGWRNLSGASESGLVALNMIAAHAYQSGAVGSFYEEDDGRISQIYVW